MLNRSYKGKDYLHFAVKAVSAQSISQTFVEVFGGGEQEAGFNESV